MSVLAGTNHIFVSNEKGNGLTVLSATDYTTVGQIKTGARPRGMVFSPDHKLLYVACGGVNRIDIVDVAAMKVIGRIGHIDDPETFDLDKKGERLFISNEDAGELSIYDLATKKLLKSIKVGLEPEGVLLNADDSKVYVASEGSNLVSVIDTGSDKRTDIGTDTRPRRFAMTPDGKELWVSTELAGRVDVIDVATNKVTGHIDFLPPGMRKQDVSPVALVIDKSGATAFVTLGRANHVGVVDVKSRTSHGLHPGRQPALGHRVRQGSEAPLRRQRRQRRCQHHQRRLAQGAEIGVGRSLPVQRRRR